MRCQRLARITLDTERSLEKGFTKKALRQLIHNAHRLTGACMQVADSFVNSHQLSSDERKAFADRLIHVQQHHFSQLKEIVPADCCESWENVRDEAVPRRIDLDVSTSIASLKDRFFRMENLRGNCESSSDVRLLCAMSRDIHCELVALMILTEMHASDASPQRLEQLVREAIGLIRELAGHLRRTIRSCEARTFVDNIRIRIALLGVLLFGISEPNEFEYPEAEWLSAESAQLLQELLLRSRQTFSLEHQRIF